MQSEKKAAVFLAERCCFAAQRWFGERLSDGVLSKS